MDGPHFFIGPQNVVARKAQLPGPLGALRGGGGNGGGNGGNGGNGVLDIRAALRRADPVDPVEGARDRFAADVDSERDAFEAFLRASLASLDGDIVGAVVQEFRHHCTREDAALVVAGDRLVDATMRRMMPELRHFQTVLDVAEARCSAGCHRVVQERRREAIGAERQRELEVLVDATRGRGAPLSTASEIDLEMIGASNSLLVWLNRFRDALIPAYRAAGDAAAEKMAATLHARKGGGIPVVGGEARPPPGPCSASSSSSASNKSYYQARNTSKSASTPLVKRNGNKKKKKARARKTAAGNFEARARPSTAPGKRRRQPPVGGGFLGMGIGSLVPGVGTVAASSGAHFNIDAAAAATARSGMPKHGGGGGGGGSGDGSSRTAFSPGNTLKSRHYMKQASGSYYAHEDTTGSNRWEGVGSASALARAVSRAPFFNGSVGRQHGRRVAPVLPPSQISAKGRRRRGMKGAASMPASLFSNPHQDSFRQQPRQKTQMRMRQQPAAAAATTRRRKPIASPSRADVFDERNVLGRLATVGSLGKSGGGADDPGDGFLPARDEFNDTLALGLDGGW
jgi:hypothetical protein